VASKQPKCIAKSTPMKVLPVPPPKDPLKPGTQMGVPSKDTYRGPAYK
jgi:hypothetical protein